MYHLFISVTGCLVAYSLIDFFSDSIFKALISPLLFGVFAIYLSVVVIYKIKGMFSVQKMTEGEKKVAPYIKATTEFIQKVLKDSNKKK